MQHPSLEFSPWPPQLPCSSENGATPQAALAITTLLTASRGWPCTALGCVFEPQPMVFAFETSVCVLD